MKRGKKILSYVVLVLLSLAVWLPLWSLLMSALTSSDELERTIGPALQENGGQAVLPVLPTWPTLQPLTELLLDTPGFFSVFWNTCLLVFPQVLGQLLVGAPAAWALAQKELRGRKLILGLYIVLMLLPFQVLMAPSYFVLRRLSLLDTPWAIILPGIFSTLPVFLMSRSFSGIPPELIEAAKLDGANAIQIFVKIGLPLGRPGILAAAVLSFLEAWSAIEQPMSFLRSQEHWPFSLFLPVISSENLASGLAAGLITLIPAVLIFKFGQKYLELGIQAEGGLG